MTYKDYITNKMKELSKVKETVFIGYNTAKGSRIYGTLGKVPVKQCLETPVAENLMMGLAMGMSLEGYRPVVCFERMDFMLIAMDAIVNHLDKLPQLSGGQFSFPVVIRAIVGSDKPLDPGLQHKQDYVFALSNMLHRIKIYDVFSKSGIDKAYIMAMCSMTPMIIVEHKEMYKSEL